MPDDYELLDLDDGLKLERFGAAVVVRPAPAARGPRVLDAPAWGRAAAEYTRRENRGEWRFRAPLPDPWVVRSAGLQYVLKATPSGQVGFFPEQTFLRERIVRRLDPGCRVLDLFGYTGGSTLAAAAAGAAVTHVDSARGVVRWARENAERNDLGGAPIRWIVDDAARFVAREARRGTTYDAVVLDPPSFGRGPKGEVWKIEKDLGALLAACRRNDMKPRKLHSDCEAWLSAQVYPGNVRQLRNLMERLAILADGDPIPQSEAERLLRPRRGSAANDPFSSCETFSEFKDESERLFLEQKLIENGWNIKRTSERLKMMRSNLYKKIEKYKLK